MELHFDQELGELKERLLLLSSLTEESVALALKALVDRDDAVARRVIAGDEQLDRLEMEMDERAIQLIALRQPKAKDLRFIAMAMKISKELERIGDQSVSIAHRALELNKEPPLKPLTDITRMAEMAQARIRQVLDAFVYQKTAVALELIKQDDELDQLNRRVHRELTDLMIEDPATITRALSLMTVARKLERMGDHTTNIAEDIIYLYEGRDVRHHHPPA
ncbi:MAG: phosphate signaling complex protein PhoU [Verrucomicrobiae bacterium]|nr:phosphate signaling complex protein PhoU [Verrucomicrobiae bacterium]